MKTRFFIKLLLGLLLILILTYAGYKLFDGISSLLLDAFTGAEIQETGYENEFVTPEPMPTMPGYMNDDSFYDNAGSVDFGDE